jgi:hypothetical protein
MPSENASRLLSRLHGVKQQGDGKWMARCPCRNDDNNPSLSVKDDNGNVAVYCHRGGGCSFEQICQAVDIEPAMMFADGGTKDSSKSFTKKAKPKSKKLVKAYKYYDEHGDFVYEKLRYVTEDGKKTFLQRRPDPNIRGEWIYTLDGVRKVLYNLPTVLNAVANGEPVWVVEGEKDADTLMEMGIVATTGPSGAGSGKWESHFTEWLAGAFVEIVADNDDAGISYSSEVHSLLSAAGCSVRLWRSPFVKDVTDHIQAGHALDQLEEIYPLTAEEREQVVNPMEELALAISEVLANRQTTDATKLTRVQSLVGGMFVNESIDTGRLVKWDDFMAEADSENYEWLIPDILERKERVIVVAAEGVGKTMLARQIAILSSFGIHPFSFQRMEPVRTLFIDLENPDRIIRRMSRNMYMQAKLRVEREFKRKAEPIPASLLMKPAGIDLLRDEDRNYIFQQVERVKPELIMFGPLYKSYVDPGGRNSESVAVEVAKFLDKLKDAYECALWIEHHAPLGASMATRELRPFGSAVWSRWPEFGISLTPDPLSMDGYTYELRHFRGARDERKWPSKLKRGRIFPFEIVDQVVSEAF